MENLIPVNVIIGDRNYRIRINPEDEETLRKTVKVINDRLIDFKTNFAGKDMQDYIAMVLLWFATQNKGSHEGSQLSSEMKEKMDAIEQMLDRKQL